MELRTWYCIHTNRYERSLTVARLNCSGCSQTEKISQIHPNTVYSKSTYTLPVAPSACKGVQTCRHTSSNLRLWIPLPDHSSCILPFIARLLDLSMLNRRYLLSDQPHIQWTLGSLPPGLIEHWPPFTAKVKNGGAIPPHSHRSSR
jgi:hypothetical protein